MKTELYQNKDLGLDNVFNPFPLSFNYSSNYHYCYAIVHYGFGDYQRGAPVGGKYGPRSKYSKNMKKLIKYLKKSDELTIFIVEDRIYKNGMKKYKPFNSALTSITKNSYPSLEPEPFFLKYIKTKDGIKEQNMEIIYSFLKDNNINEIRFAGEYGWHCLLAAAKEFYKNGFNVKGIRNCIYPTTFPGKINGNLYFDDGGIIHLDNEESKIIKEFYKIPQEPPFKHPKN